VAMCVPSCFCVCGKSSWVSRARLPVVIARSVSCVGFEFVA